MSSHYDIAVVGGGILGLAHAYAAARLGKRVVVLDRESRAIGASVRNFGFVTVTGQQQGACWRRARRTREIWAEIAPRAGIAIEQKGLLVAARRPEALAVLEAFRRTPMGWDCGLHTPEQAADRWPVLRSEELAGALYSPHELRVESRTAVPKLAAWLSEAFGVAFLRPAQVLSVAPPRLETSAGPVEAEAAVVCPGDDFLTLFPERLAAYGLTRCLLQMLRVRPRDPGFRLPCPVMSDLGLVRYLGYAELPEAVALHACLEREQPRHLAEGVHLIAVGGADGSLIVGDSHRYGASPEPFAPAEVEALILEELEAVTTLESPQVVERWTGSYASASDRLMLVDRPAEAVRLVMVTSGTGASTGFAIAEEVIAELFGSAPAESAEVFDDA